MDPTTKLFDVWGDRVWVALLLLWWWWCLSPNPNPRPRARARTTRDTARPMTIQNRWAALREAVKDFSVAMTVQGKGDDAKT